MLITYTPNILLSELKTQGVVIKPTPEGNLSLEGKISDIQLCALKTLKPRIINAINNAQKFRFGPNEHLFDNFGKCLRIFDTFNPAANRFIRYLQNLELSDSLEINFNQPTSEAYSAELKLAEEVEKTSNEERNTETLKRAFDDFIQTHYKYRGFTDWMTDEVPLFMVEIFLNGELIDYSIANSVQAAVIRLYWSVVNPETKSTVTRI